MEIGRWLIFFVKVGSQKGMISSFHYCVHGAFNGRPKCRPQWTHRRAAFNWKAAQNGQYQLISAWWATHRLFFCAKQSATSATVHLTAGPLAFIYIVTRRLTSANSRSQINQSISHWLQVQLTSRAIFVAHQTTSRWSHCSAWTFCSMEILELISRFPERASWWSTRFVT